MSGKFLILLLIDPLDLLTIRVEISACLEKRRPFVQDRVRQATDAKHVVGRVQSLLEHILWGLVIEVSLAVRVQLMIIVPILNRRWHSGIPRQKRAESETR